MNISQEQIKQILEGAIMAAGDPISVSALGKLFDKEDRPETKDLRDLLSALAADYADRGIELKEVASGFRFQVRAELAPWIGKLWGERAPRYSRALLETLALIAYQQPITRAEIEDVRGVAVSTNIIRTLLEREWVRMVGQKDVPGKPALYATTKKFLDYFNLKTLSELPALSELRDLDKIAEQFELTLPPELVAQLADEKVSEEPMTLDETMDEEEPMEVIELKIAAPQEDPIEV